MLLLQERGHFPAQKDTQQDDFYHLMNGRVCGEAWDAISRYVYTALQGGAIMTTEAKTRFMGKIWVPEDLERIDL